MITTGDTRMSVMPQVAFPAPVQIPDPLAGLNSGLDTAGKYAQLAENEQMNPLRQQLAQLNVQEAQKRVQEAQKRLDQPIWDLKSQTTELQPRDVPPVDQGATIDDAAYQALIKGGLSKEEAEGALTWQGPNVSGESVTGAHEILANEGFDEDTINKLLNPSQPPAQEIPQDLYSVSTYEDRNHPGRTRTERALHQTAEQMRDIAAQSMQRSAVKGHFKQVTIMQTDANGNKIPVVMNLNEDTNELTPLGTNAAVASTIDLNAFKGQQISENMRYAAQTQQARAVWANVIGRVPDQHELAQMELEARTIGANVPMLALINRSSSAFYIKSYMKALSSQNPDVRSSAQDALPDDPVVRKSILAEIDQISKAAPALGAQLDTANGIKVPGVTPGAPTAVSIPSNPAVAGQSRVTVRPGVNMPAPVSVAPAKNFATLQAAQAAYAAGTLQVGDKVTVGGQPGTWQ